MRIKVDVEASDLKGLILGLRYAYQSLQQEQVEQTDSVFIEEDGFAVDYSISKNGEVQPEPFDVKTFTDSTFSE